MEIEMKVKNFLDSDGRLTVFPSKRKSKIYAMMYLVTKFEVERKYTEKEVNAIINESITFGDPVTLRRELYDYRFLGRDADGREYWLEETQPTLVDFGMEE